MSAPCRVYSAGSLEDYLDIISFLNECMRKKTQNKGQVYRMWFRGQERQNYTLLPTLLRKSGGTKYPYSRDHLREDMRYQHFRSKCTQLIDTSPESRIEWLEILQHHLGSTRLMDWSESAISSLIFALEAFIDPTDDRQLNYRRASMTPSVWVLDPAGVNRHIYEVMSTHKDLITKAVRDIVTDPADVGRLRDALAVMLVNHQDIYFETREDSVLDGVVCLSVIENERRTNGNRLYQLLQDGEFNPFFYLLLRYYSDGLAVPMDTLPPLAIVHPYHSNRIQSQHGVFTVTPHYLIDLAQIGGTMDKRPMERQTLISDCLYQINITRPAKVAKELLTIGERRSSVYPEMDIYVRDIETGRWQV